MKEEEERNEPTLRRSAYARSLSVSSLWKKVISWERLKIRWSKRMVHTLNLPSSSIPPVSAQPP